MPLPIPVLTDTCLTCLMFLLALLGTACCLLLVPLWSAAQLLSPGLWATAAGATCQQACMPLLGLVRLLYVSHHSVPEECPPEVDHLIARCMHADPAERPSAKEIHEALVDIQYSPALPRAPSLPPARSGGGSAGGGSAAAGGGAAPATAPGGRAAGAGAAAAAQQPGGLSPVQSAAGGSGAQQDSASPAVAVVAGPARPVPFDGISAPAVAADGRSASGSAAGAGSVSAAPAADEPAHFWRWVGAGVNPFAERDQQQQGEVSASAPRAAATAEDGPPRQDRSSGGAAPAIAAAPNVAAQPGKASAPPAGGCSGRMASPFAI